MRDHLAQTLEKIVRQDKSVYFLTADLGFNALENLQKTMGDRFINAGVTEQSMVTMAAGMAFSGAKPWVYSIAPFITLKTVEQIRNDVVHANLPVKLIGMGGGYGYGYHGTTHHVLEDLAVLLPMQPMKIYVPAFVEDVVWQVKKMHQDKNPAYLRLAKVPPQTATKPGGYGQVRQSSKGGQVTIITLGTMVHNAWQALKKLKRIDIMDLWVISELPCQMPKNLLESVKKTGKLIIVEEHVQNGGLAQHLAPQLLQAKIKLNNFIHLCAQGYPSGLVGSQEFYWQESDIDPNGIFKAIKKVL